MPGAGGAKGVGAPATEVIEGSEPPCAYWESNWGSLEEKPVHLTAEPFLLPHCFPLTIHNTPRKKSCNNGNYNKKESRIPRFEGFSDDKELKRLCFRGRCVLTCTRGIGIS